MVFPVFRLIASVKLERKRHFKLSRNAIFNALSLFAGELAVTTSVENKKKIKIKVVNWCNSVKLFLF